MADQPSEQPPATSPRRGRRPRVTCPRCGRPDLLVNDDGSVRSHSTVYRVGATQYRGRMCRDPQTGKAHTPGMFPTTEEDR